MDILKLISKKYGANNMGDHRGWEEFQIFIFDIWVTKGAYCGYPASMLWQVKNFLIFYFLPFISH